jgi:tryptophanyl-tRNA synthetase
MSKEVILTGIRANNDLTLGNYFGAILPLVDMAKTHSDKYQVSLFVPDLHSFTTPIDHSQLQAQIMHNLRVFAAAEMPLDHPDVHIYRQSYISAHSELTWILDCFTGVGEMGRMTQFKDKTSILLSKGTSVTPAIKAVDGTFVHDETRAGINDLERQDRISLGLFNYPVLMAADILLYGATYVPVGEDQTQHLEFTRDIAERLNSKFGELFTVPKAVKKQHEFFGKDQGLRIKDLQDPTKKMSKSDETGKGVIFLGDKPEVAAKKIMGATTDSEGVIHFNWEKQPGITNLLQLLALATNRPQEDVNKQWEGKTAYGDLKKAVAEAITGFLQGLQGQLALVDDSKLLAKLEASEVAMNKTANATLLKVQKAVGLR